MNDGSMAGWRELKYEWWLILEKWKVEDNGSMEGGREWKYGSMEGGREWKYGWLNWKIRKEWKIYKFWQYRCSLICERTRLRW